MDSKIMDKHLRFLSKYACDNNIVFKVTKKGVTVMEIGNVSGN